jgi:hypothetical protein
MWIPEGLHIVYLFFACSAVFVFRRTTYCSYNISEVPKAQLSDVKDQKRLNIAICDSHISSNSSARQHADGSRDAILENHRKYSLKHNYTYFRQTTSLMGANGSIIECHWTKASLLIKLLSEPYKFDWVLWVDSDAIFVDMFIPIENLLRDNANGIVTESTVSSESLNLNDNTRYLRQNRTHIPDRYEVIDALRRAKRTVTSLVFSGDTNAINTGVLLFHRTDYSLYLLNQAIKIGHNLEKFGEIAMGTDNAAFSILLGGCNTNNSVYSDYKKCYDRVDIGFKNGKYKTQITGSSYFDESNCGYDCN